MTGTKNGIFTKYPVATAMAFSIVCMLPTMIMRDFTPSNELRYLSIADEAIREGNVFAFTNHGIEYADKPPLYFWIVMLCKIIAGRHSMFLLSLFSMIPAVVTTCVMDRWTRFEDPVKRASSAFMLMTSALFLGMSVFLRMDMLMTMFIVLALHSFHLMYTGEGDFRRQSILLPVWIFLALFTKGPVGLLMPPLVILCFLLAKGKLREAGRYLGFKTWGIIAALSAVWLTCVWLEGGPEYINNLLFKQTVGRAVNAFTHARPFWFYLVTLLWCLAPYTLLLIGSFMASLLPVRKAGAEKSSDLEILFLCTIISTVAMLSSFSSKLPIYLVPVFPFCVYLFPTVLDRIGERGWMRWSVGIFQILLLCAGIATLLFLSGSVTIPAAACLLDEYSFVREAPVVNAVILLTLANAMGTWFLIKRKSVNIPALLLSAGLFLAAFSASAVLRDLNPYIGYGSICSRVPEGTDVATIFLHRPENIDVYTGRQITDFGDDPAKLSEAVKAHIELTGENVGSGRPLTIITRTSRMETTPELQKLFSEGTVIYAGPYCLTTISRK